MKIETKEKLIEKLIELNSYPHYKYKDDQVYLAYCYCIDFCGQGFETTRIRDEDYCAYCGKKISKSVKTAIKDCREEMYEKYANGNGYIFEDITNPSKKIILKYNSAKYARPCFWSFLRAYYAGDLKLLGYLQEHGLVYNSDVRKRVIDYEIKKRKSKKMMFNCDIVRTPFDLPQGMNMNCFNRMLTKEEWMYLIDYKYDGEGKLEDEIYDFYSNREFNARCNCSVCFDVEWETHRIKDLANEFNKAGYDAKVVCYCNDCMKEKDKPPMEFWFRIDENDEYSVSNPEVGSLKEKYEECDEKKKEYLGDYCNEKYEDALKYLVGNRNDLEWHRKDISNYVTYILGNNIKLTKKQVEKMLTAFIDSLYFENGIYYQQFNVKTETEAPAYEREIIKKGYLDAVALVDDKQYDYTKLKKKLSKYPNDYSFTFKEYKKIAKCFLLYKRNYKRVRIEEGYINDDYT